MNHMKCTSNYKILYHGPLWRGSTALHRCEAMYKLLGDRLIESNNNVSVVRRTGFDRIIHGLRWRLGVPKDDNNSVEKVTDLIREHNPEIVFIDSSQYFSGRILRLLRRQHPAIYVYYTPDDIIARHNRSFAVRRSFPEWDIFFTTKTFNVPELRERGVKHPILIGIAYHPKLHRPLAPLDVGGEFEKFDCVFMGSYETPRLRAVNALADSGLSVVVYSNDWPKERTSPSVVMRPCAFDEGFIQGMHTGKLALNFLRKINRDQITTRSVEIPAMARVMLAEKTMEHDDYFIDGKEYVGFTSVNELVSFAKSLLANPSRCASIAAAARERCIHSGYSTDCRAITMINSISEIYSMYKPPYYPKVR